MNTKKMPQQQEASTPSSTTFDIKSFFDKLVKHLQANIPSEKHRMFVTNLVSFEKDKTYSKHEEMSVDETQKRTMNILESFLEVEGKYRELIITDNLFQSSDDEIVLNIRTMILSFRYLIYHIKLGQDIDFEFFEPLFNHVLLLHSKIYKLYEKSYQIFMDNYKEYDYEKWAEEEDNTFKVLPWRTHAATVIYTNENDSIPNWVMLMYYFLTSFLTELLPWGIKYLHEFGPKPKLTDRQRILNAIKKKKAPELKGSTFQSLPFFQFILLKYFYDRKVKHTLDNATSSEITQWNRNIIEERLLKECLIYWGVFISSITSTHREDQQMALDEEDEEDEDDEDEEDELEDVFDGRGFRTVGANELDEIRTTTTPSSTMQHSTFSDPLKTNLTIAQIKDMKRFIAHIIKDYMFEPFLPLIYEFSEYESTQSHIREGLLRNMDSIRAHSQTVVGALCNCFGKPLCIALLPMLLEDLKVTGVSNPLLRLTEGRNRGKVSWTVRQKAYNCVGILVREMLTTNITLGGGVTGNVVPSYEIVEFVIENFVDPFCRYALEEMKQAPVDIHDIIVKQTAILVTFAFSKLYTNREGEASNNWGLIEHISNQADTSDEIKEIIEFIHVFRKEIMELLPKKLVDSHYSIREAACVSLASYISEMKVLKESFILEILKTCETFVQNFVKFSVIITAVTDKLESGKITLVDDDNQPIVTTKTSYSKGTYTRFTPHFNKLYSNLFEKICESGELIYPEDLENLTEEEKKRQHHLVVVCLFDSFYDSLEFTRHFSDTNLIEKFLDYGKKQIMQNIFTLKEVDKTEDLISAFSTTINAVMRNIDGKVLVELFQKHDMFTFLTQFVRVCHNHCNYRARDCAVHTIGNMSNADLFHLCPFDVDKETGKVTPQDATHDFLYDFVFQVLKKEAVVGDRFYEETTLEDDSIMKKKIIVYHNAVWSLGRVILSAGRKGVKDERFYKFMKEMAPKLIRVLKLFANKDFYTTEEVIDDITGYLSNVCITIAYISLIDIDLVAPEYMSFSSSFIEHVISDSNEDLDEEKIAMATSIFRLTEYCLEELHGEGILPETCMLLEHLYNSPLFERLSDTHLFYISRRVMEKMKIFVAEQAREDDLF
ncbi:predicted protein [Naegleria gruberi]|uniref:Predicted protein n=1 Tax=Naegleria gruberi TaxID=5762 RepID=D2VLM3_NAEGR|nr:uncharacterized protein NAEGRDRAFT_50576 [Naegleria gruberi]EFC42416.1 predicted protein [Naegleria gruberi]|eukprot:XP_002675160.1 predicted protein [Naegleria gruberi strain NEG-M]